MVKAAGAEDVVAANTDHQAAIENQGASAAAFLFGSEQVIFHFPDHNSLRVLLVTQLIYKDLKDRFSGYC